PSFEAFGRYLEAANPFAFWLQASRMAWFPWLEAARVAMLPFGGTLSPPNARSDARPPQEPRREEPRLLPWLRRPRRRGPARAADRLPHPQRRCRHFDAIDPERRERVDDRINYRRRRADGARLADALDAERICLARHLLELRFYVRHRVGTRHAVVHETAGDELAGLAVLDLVLEQCLPEPLHYAAVDLAAHDQRVENAAKVVDDEVAVNDHLARLRIHLQLACVRAVGMTRRIGAPAAARLEPDAEF